MNPTTVWIVACVSLSTIVVASLLRTSAKQKTKEGFEAKEIGLGLTIALSILLVIFAGVFLYYYYIPKQPNVLRRPMYYNLE